MSEKKEIPQPTETPTPIRLSLEQCIEQFVLYSGSAIPEKAQAYHHCAEFLAEFCRPTIATLTAQLEEERERCKRDVCMYCGGRAIGYNRIPDGPNEAGNWTHQYTTTMRTQDRALCVASAIFAREAFNKQKGIEK